MANRINLFFDFECSGHHSEYIEHLLLFLKKKKSCDQLFYFVLHPEIAERLPIIREMAEHPFIKFIYLNTVDLSALINLDLWRKSFKLFKLMDTYASKLEADNVMLMSLNVFQLAIPFYKKRYSISGVLFKQFVRLDKESNKFVYYRKYLQTKLMLLNRSIKNIFILNDGVAVKSLNVEFNTSVFKLLIDPIPEINPLDDFDIYKEYNIPNNKKIFLHIGSLDYRKGSLEILDSLDFITEQVRDKIYILYVGKAKNNLKDDLNDKQKLLADQRIFSWDASFVSNEKMKSLFNQCYAVLMPYKNSEASSGILGHAAASKKNVIATGKGLLKDLVNQYNLGILIDEVSSLQIANAITDTVLEPYQVPDTDMFVSERTPEKFSETILSLL